MATNSHSLPRSLHNPDRRHQLLSLRRRRLDLLHHVHPADRAAERREPLVAIGQTQIEAEPDLTWVAHGTFMGEMRVERPRGAGTSRFLSGQWLALSKVSARLR
jgi:hypothetical protein